MIISLWKYTITDAIVRLFRLLWGFSCVPCALIFYRLVWWRCSLPFLTTSLLTAFLPALPSPTPFIHAFKSPKDVQAQMYLAAKSSAKQILYRSGGFRTLANRLPVACCHAVSGRRIGLADVEQFGRKGWSWRSSLRSCAADCMLLERLASDVERFLCLSIKKSTAIGTRWLEWITALQLWVN